jgi:putative SOS response-associated peptidase YedK
MCGRYTLIRLNDVLEKFPWIEHAPPDLVPRFNVAPTQPVLGVANDRPDRFEHFVWGLIPSWAKDASIGNRMINARAETLAEKPAFRTALRRRRCLVIADGFYEWKPEPGGGKKPVKTPMYIRMRDARPFAFAGLWDTWRDPAGGGSEVRSCTIVTTSPNDLMKDIHDRMPVIVPPERYRDWLEKGELDPNLVSSMLDPYPPEQMEAYAVSTYVNSPKNDGEKCIESMTKETLF